MTIILKNKHTLQVDEFLFHCCIGKNGSSFTKKEGDILNLLCTSSGNVIKREVILNEIWGDDNYFNGRSLDVFITKLRKYLSEEKSVRIENIHGIGFCLKSS